MSVTEATVIGAVLGFQVSALAFLAYSLARTRERLARVEARMNGHGNGDRHG